MKARAPQTITVAAAQIAARLMNDAAATLESVSTAIQRAGEKRVELLVLPECAYPAYLIGSPTSYRAGEHMKSEEFVAWLSGQAARYRLHIICGFVEDDGQTLFNSAIFLDDRGRELGRARKRFLWNADHDWFSPGDEIRAFDSVLGRIGIVICAEARDPELLATLMADGAQLIAMPTCWINGARDPGVYENPQVDFVVEARAREFGVPFVCADKWGLELGATGYVGQSRIVRADGSIAAEAPPTGDTVIASRLLLDSPPAVWVSERRKLELQNAPSAEASGVESQAAGAPRRVTLAAMPAAVATNRYTGGMGQTLFEPLRQRGVSLLMLNILHEAQAEQLEMLAGAYDMRAVAFPSRADVYEMAGVRLGCVGGQWTRSFAPWRALVLGGAEVILVFDAPEDVPILQTRALENRVFVMAANHRTATIIGPDGRILARSSPEQFSEAVAQVDLAEAHDKSVAPKTNIFMERRPALYRY